MPEEKASLEDLERLLAQRLEEVQRLQKEIEQRKAQAQFDELTTLRQSLEEQLREVNDKISRIGQATGTMITAQSPPALASSEPVAVTQPAVAAAIVESKPTPAATTEMIGTVPLTKMIFKVLEETSQPLRAKEIRDRVRQAGYVSKSTDFALMVHQVLTRLKKKQVIIHADGKYRLPDAEKTSKLAVPTELAVVAAIVEPKPAPPPAQPLATTHARTPIWERLVKMVEDQKGRPITVEEMAATLQRQNYRGTMQYLLRLVHARVKVLITKGVLALSQEGPGMILGKKSMSVETATASMISPVDAKGSDPFDKVAPTISQLLVKMVLDRGGRPITSKEMVEELERQGYRSKTKNLLRVVHSRVADLIVKGLVKRFGQERDQGVVLGDGQAAAAKAYVEAQSKTMGGKGALYKIIIRALTKSDQPLKSREIIDGVLKAGNEITSKNIPNRVRTILGRMKQNKVIIHTADGYRLRKK